jgi:general stress protein YciG
LEYTEKETRKERRGISAMSEEMQREIDIKGGRAEPQKASAHERYADEAREAGRKGGMASRGGRGKLPMSGSSDVDTIDINSDSSTPEPAA